MPTSRQMKGRDAIAALRGGRRDAETFTALHLRPPLDYNSFYHVCGLIAGVRELCFVAVSQKGIGRMCFVFTGIDVNSFHVNPKAVFINGVIMVGENAI